MSQALIPTITAGPPVEKLRVAKPTHADVAKTALDGAARVVPWLFGIVPYGLVIGAVISAGSVPLLSGWLGGPLIFGGSAHLATLELLNSGTGVAIVVLTALIVHSRLLLYSASLSPHWKHTSRRFRIITSAMIADPTYAIATDIYRDHEGRRAHIQYLGACGLLAALWLGSITAGMLVGSNVPAGLHLNDAIPLYLVGHIMATCRKRPERRAACIAAGAAIFAIAAPLNLGLLTGIVAGVVAGSHAKKGLS